MSSYIWELHVSFASINPKNTLLSPFKRLIQYVSPLPTATPTIRPTPTPKPLTFAQMNERFGPCVWVPTIFYHHIQGMEEAKKQGHAQLTVDMDIFRKQMEYLQSHGYTTISMQQLVSFFDEGTPLPQKPILLTFDDGYTDFAGSAAPILRELGFRGTVFIPTGLVENTGYMRWNEIVDISHWGTILFANHTWSHHNMNAENSVIEKEITVADMQLAERGLNQPKVFAYPYGWSNRYAEQVLGVLGYKLAFATHPGSIACKQLRYDLPRIRIGNANLSSYGL